MDDVIRDLLDVLETAEYSGTPLTDTDIRERLFELVDRGFIHEAPGYQVPTDLLDDCGGNAKHKAKVLAALSTFLNRARQQAATFGLDTPEKRQTAFLESDVTSSSSATDVNEFFN